MNKKNYWTYPSNKVWFTIKWWIAEKIDRPDKCWANLAMWAMGYNSFWEAWNAKQVCKDETPIIGWCGKCQKKINHQPTGEKE